MKYREITREELENLYSHDGITRKELRYLLRITPNRIPQKLSEVFRTELNTFKIPDHKKVSLRGFVHSPPKKLLEMFNSIHYELISEHGDYKLFILSSSPIEQETAVPLILPGELTTKKILGQAHFIKITGYVKNISDIKPGTKDGLFFIADELTVLGFDELFSINDPLLTISDFADMIYDRFNTNELLTNGIISWFMSSPIYEGRLGGNGFSPISPFENQYKCDKKVLDEFQKDLLKIPLPYFSSVKNRNSVFDYNTRMKTRLKFIRSEVLNYNHEKNLDHAENFLNSRPIEKKGLDKEVNLSTSTLILDTIKTRPLESFVQNPILPAKVLIQTDLPILFTKDDLLINESESEIFEYSTDLTQLIYQQYLKHPLSSFEFIDTAGAVKTVMDNIKRSMPELHELMIYGIIFNTNPIGGLGEHLTRISNSYLRSGVDLTGSEAIKKSETFFERMITKLFDEFNKPITDLYYQLEDKRAERDQIKTHKLRNNINSILFELNNTYKDGWRYELFEAELKKRTDHGAAKIKEYFEKLVSQKEVAERSPGLYWHILGFDRYL
jgi:hypothetical protein